MLAVHSLLPAQLQSTHSALPARAPFSAGYQLLIPFYLCSIPQATTIAFACRHVPTLWFLVLFSSPTTHQYVLHSIKTKAWGWDGLLFFIFIYFFFIFIFFLFWLLFLFLFIYLAPEKMRDLALFRQYVCIYLVLRLEFLMYYVKVDNSLCVSRSSNCAFH